MIAFTVNGQAIKFSGDPDTPLLWVIRDTIGLKGTKYGCGIGYCGACSVHLNGSVTRSCLLPVSAVAGMFVTTIEGITVDPGRALQTAWVEEAVPQCGYCQSGMIMTAADLLSNNAHPTDEDIDRAMTNLCRCGTYPRIRAAIHRAATGDRGGETDA